MLIDRGEDAATISTFIFLLSLPWTVKPLYGLISDFVPLAGYRAKSYLVLGSIISAAALFALAAQPLSIDRFQLLLWLLPPAISVAFADVVINALLIERGQPQGWTGNCNRSSGPLSTEPRPWPAGAAVTSASII